MTRILLGTDPDRPGAGVGVVEERTVPGADQIGASTAGAGVVPVGRPQRCEVYENPAPLNSVLRSLAGEADTAAPAGLGADRLEQGNRYFRECRYADDSDVVLLDDFLYSPAPAGPTGTPAPPAADLIAREVYTEVPLVFPTPRTSPPRDAEQLVGLPTWLWVDDDAWRSFDAAASVAGVTVTVTATPSHVVWDMGDGTTLTCRDPGTPWQPGRSEGDTDCSHVYQFVSDGEPNRRYQGRATIVWSVTWSATTGESGTLPDASRATPFELDVRQRQAIIGPQ